MRKIDNPTDEAIRDKLLREIYANEYNGSLKFPLLCCVVSGGNIDIDVNQNQSFSTLFICYFMILFSHNQNQEEI